MKINILPNFHIDKWEDDYQDEFKPFYTGNKKWEEPIVNDTLYLAAFLIPFCALLFFMFSFGFAPFGDNCMFVVDGALNNLPVFTQFVTQLRGGDFHLFSLQGTTGGELYSSFAFFMASPFTLIAALFDQSAAVGVLSVLTVLRIALSAPIFLYYLTHRLIGKRGSKYDITLLLFPLGYAMSSFALVQYNDFMFLDVFMLFPLLMLGLERILVGQSGKLYYIVLSLCLFSNFYLGIIVLLLSFLLYFFFSNRHATETLTGVPKLLLMDVCALCTSAVTVIPGMIGLYRNIISAFTMPQPYTITQLGTFFLEHFFYNTPSYATTASYGCNLYIGSIMLVLIALHFLNQNLPVKKRIADCVLLLFFILFLTYSSTNMLMQLMLGRETSFTCFSFVYLFVLLIMAFDTFYAIRDIPLWRVLVACVLPITLAMVALNLADPLPNFSSVNMTIDLLILYTIFVLLFRLGSIKRKVFYTLLVSVGVLELLANAYQNEYCLSQERNTLEMVLTNTSDSEYAGSLETGRSEVFMQEATPDTNMNHLFSRYGSNPLLSHTVTTPAVPLYDSLSGLRYLYCTTAYEDISPNTNHFTQVAKTEDYTIYENKFAFPTAFTVTGSLQNVVDTSTEVTRINSVAKALGASQELLTDANITPSVSASMPDTVKISDLGNQIYGFSKQYSEEIESLDFTYYYSLKFKFIAPKDGELYISSPTIDYYDNVKWGSEYTFRLLDPLDLSLDRMFSFHAYYLNNAVMQELHDKTQAAACNIMYRGSDTIQIQTDTDASSTLLTILPYSDFYTVTVDGKRVDIAYDFEGQLAVPVDSGSHEVRVSYHFIPFTIGLWLSLFSLVILCAVALCRKWIPLPHHDEKGTAYRLLCSFTSWCRDNYVYLLSFLLPLFMFLALMVYMNTEPFGTYTLFEGDGVQIELPSIINSARTAKEAPHAHVWNGGGGYQKANSGSLLYRILPLHAIPLYIMLRTILTISLLGPCFVFYLTHRLHGKRADKRDVRTLIAALSYSLCSYVIMMFNNTGWYTGLLLLPFIMLGMDYLMIKGKKRYYIFFLGLCITKQYYIAMFICFYLVIRFFTYDFKDFKDFVRKGLRFALSSLGMVLLCANSIFGTLTALNASTYGAEIGSAAGEAAGAAASLLPAHYFFDSWTYYINQLLFLPDSFYISWNEGNANIYFGILPVFLIAVYLIAKHVSIKDKLRFLFSMGLLFVTLNESVLNFIFNGLHYQNGVPNRFSFLLAFTAAGICYDSICLIRKESPLRLSLAFLLTCGVFGVSFFCSEQTGALTTSFAISMVLLLSYFILQLCYRLLKSRRVVLSALCTALFCFEMLTNSFILANESPTLTDILTIIEPAVTYLRETKDIDNSLERISIQSPVNQNYPYTQNIKSNHIFAAGSITPYQKNYANLIGCSTSSNALVNFFSATPMGNALGCNRYLIMTRFGMSEMSEDYDNYELIAVQGDNYILQNHYCLPFGYALPSSAVALQEDTTTPYDYWSKLQYVMNGSDDIISVYPVYHVDDTTENKLTDYSYNLTMTPQGQGLFRFHFTVPKTGMVYLMLADFQYVGEYKEGDVVDIEFDASDYARSNEEEILTLCVFNKDAFYELYDDLSAHPLVIDAFTNDTINGHIDMPEDAIVSFAMPYDANWKAYVDGTQTESVALADAFHAIYVPEGEHEIHLEYDPPKKTNWYLVIQRTSWVVFLLLCALAGYMHYRKKKFAAEEPDASVPTNSEN